MKYKYLIIVSLFLVSCSVLFPDGVRVDSPMYDYNYQTFNKKLDYNKKVNYLLNPTNFGNSKSKLGSNLPEVVEFFRKKLGNNVVLKKDYKDENKKLIIPFHIHFDITDEEITFLKNNTKLDYIILSKIEYLDELKNAPLNSSTNKEFYFSEFGARSHIKIVDIKNNMVFLEMSCSGKVVPARETKDFNTGELKSPPTSIYAPNSYSVGEKTVKKLLKKIK